MKGCPILLALFALSFPLAVARADHGNLASFNELTGRWYGVAKTRVPNESVEVHWSRDGSSLLCALDQGGTRLMKVDPASGKMESLLEGNPVIRDFRAQQD